MPNALPDERWLAIRELTEGALPTHPRVAAAAGVEARTISRRAGEEGWRTLDLRRKRVAALHRQMIALAAALSAGEESDAADDAEDTDDAAQALGDYGADVEAELDRLDALPPDDRIARIGGLLTRRTGELLLRAEAGLPIESRQVASLNGLVQLSERVAVMAREEGLAQQAKSDDELAHTLERINARILHLADEQTRELLVGTFGLEQDQVDAVLPAPVEHDVPYGPNWRRELEAAQERMWDAQEASRQAAADRLAARNPG